MKSLAFIMCFSAMFLPGVPWAVNAQPAAPQLFLEEPLFEAGEVREGSRISHDFTVVNRGKATLQIQKVSPG